MKDSKKAYIFIGIIIVIIISLKVLQNKSVVYEGYEEESEADYTQKYTKQIEDYLKVEIEISNMVRRENKYATWNIKESGASIEEQIKSLPDPDKYIESLKKNRIEIDKVMADLYDMDKADIDKINRITSVELLPFPEGEMPKVKKYINELNTKLQTAIDNMTLSSLSKFKERAIRLQKHMDAIYVLTLSLYAKLALKPKEPKTAKEFMEYEINKFAIPLWPSLKFVIDRLSKLASIGPNGKQKYKENEANGIAIKEISDKTGIAELDKFYGMMTKTKGNPPVKMETFENLFVDPLSYVNLLKYFNGKFKEMDAAVNKKKEGFWGGYDLMVEGWEDSEGTGKSKCVPCKIEADLPNIDTLKSRHEKLKTTKWEFKHQLDTLLTSQKKAQEIEKKAASGELMDEMVANRKEEE